MTAGPENDSTQPQASEPVSETATASNEVQLEDATVSAHRQRLPDTRKSITHKFNIAGHEGYLTAGLYDNGQPGELFIKLAKEGSTLAGMADTIGILVSLCLQYGVPIDDLTQKLSGTRYEPLGHTQHPEIPTATSLSDYLVRWLELTFGNTDKPSPQSTDNSENE